MGGEISYESHVRMKHRDTGTWLHLNKGIYVYHITTTHIQLNPSIRATIVEGNLGLYIERCLYLRGRFVLKRLLCDITMWPF